MIFLKPLSDPVRPTISAPDLRNIQNRRALLKSVPAANSAGVARPNPSNRIDNAGGDQTQPAGDFISDLDGQFRVVRSRHTVGDPPVIEKFLFGQSFPPDDEHLAHHGDRSGRPSDGCKAQFQESERQLDDPVIVIRKCLLHRRPFSFDAIPPAANRAERGDIGLPFGGGAPALVPGPHPYIPL